MVKERPEAGKSYISNDREASFILHRLNGKAVKDLEIYSHLLTVDLSLTGDLWGFGFGSSAFVARHDSFSCDLLAASICSLTFLCFSLYDGGG